MQYNLLPLDETMHVIGSESNSKAAFEQIIDFSSQKLTSTIWREFKNMDIETDTVAASEWIQDQIDNYPDSKGIFLGLDTLNMEGSEGSNLEIGLSHTCNPRQFSDEWTYDCQQQGSKHLIKELKRVSASFNDEDRWSSDERRFAEYIVFLGYSGIVLRGALKNLKAPNDFLSIWGFHDGDSFLLMQNVNHKKSIITAIDL